MKNILTRPVHRITYHCKVFSQIIAQGNDYFSLSQPQVCPDEVWTPADTAVPGYLREWWKSTGGESIWIATVFSIV